MLPILQLGPLALPVYPISLLLAFWAGLALSARAARRLGVDGDHIWNAGLYGLLATIIVGRLAHGIAFWPAYRHAAARYRWVECPGISLGTGSRWLA